MFVIIQQLFTDMKTCGLDVHKDMIFCAIYDGKDPEVKKYDTFPVQRDAQRQLHTRRSAGTAEGVHPRLPPLIFKKEMPYGQFIEVISCRLIGFAYYEARELVKEIKR
jgi:hypothetical protein